MTKDLKCVRTFCNIFISHYLKPYIDKQLMYIVNLVHISLVHITIVKHIS